MKKFTILLILLLTATVVQAEGSTNWTDNLTISGDFRLRTERVDDQERNHQRIRARIFISGDIEDDLSVG